MRPTTIQQVFYLLWGVLIVSTILVSGYMIGAAVHSSNRAQHDREIRCIHEGGRMEAIVGQGLVCRND